MEQGVFLYNIGKLFFHYFAYILDALPIFPIFLKWLDLPHNFAYIFLNFPIFLKKNNFYATTWFNFDLPSILAEFMYLIQKIFFIDTMIIFNFKKSISRISEKKILSYITPPDFVHHFTPVFSMFTEVIKVATMARNHLQGWCREDNRKPSKNYLFKWAF